MIARPRIDAVWPSIRRNHGYIAWRVRCHEPGLSDQTVPGDILSMDERNIRDGHRHVRQPCARAKRSIEVAGNSAHYRMESGLEKQAMKGTIISFRRGCGPRSLNLSY